jgi:hypothetical protein
MRKACRWVPPGQCAIDGRTYLRRGPDATRVSRVVLLLLLLVHNE